MGPVYCIMFTASLNDDVRDVLFQTAYLMLKSRSQRRKVRSDFCEGVVTTTFKSLAIYGTGGIQFDAHLETNKGDLAVSYMVRQEDLQQLEETEYGAWLSPDEMTDPPEDLEERVRPNPIRRLAKKHREN